MAMECGKELLRSDCKQWYHCEQWASVAENFSELESGLTWMGVFGLKSNS